MKDDSNKEWGEQERLEEERKTVQESPQLKEEELEEENKTDAASNAPVLHYAGFWMRFWAYLLDLIVIGSLSRLIIYPLFRVTGLETSSGELFSAINIATAAVFYLYFIFMTKRWGQTIGKMVFGLKVVPLHGSSLSWQAVLFREWIGRYLSVTIPFLYVLVAFLSKKQGLHDYFAETAVIHERLLTVPSPAPTL